MRKQFGILATLLLLLTSTGCYHAQIMTGQEPSDKIVEKKWFLGFVNGLVIPEELDVSEECPAGVAKVETKMSFANQLVTIITGGIFSPMTIKVTCAAGGSGMNVMGRDDMQRLLSDAAARSLAEQTPIYISWTSVE